MKGTKKLKGVEQRGRILEVSAKLFATQGYESTSMTVLAKKLNLSKASIYYYFASKDEIYEEIIVDTLARLVATVEDKLASDAPPREQLHTFMTQHAKFFEDNIWAFTAMLYGFGGVHALTRHEEVIRLRDRHENTLRNILSAGVKHGDFRNIDHKLSARAILSILNWMVRWFKHGGAKSADAFADMFFDLLMQGLVPRNDS